ncbi:MAG TPA: cell division protein FtsH, partial [Rhodospirillaceae bacterium]|nr:cell division protein FtsH [Rhodospirillaceae bacterium]
GPLRYDENEEEIFLGHSVTQRKNTSDATAKLIDDEIRKIVDDGESKAREVLTGNMDELHALAKGLLEYETLSGEEVDALLKGEPVARPDEDSTPPEGGQSSPVPSTGKKGKKGKAGGMPKP